MKTIKSMGIDVSVSSGEGKNDKDLGLTDHIKLAIHGSRKTGKTSLIRRLLDLPFVAHYSPTPYLRAYEIGWHPISKPDDFVKITVWDTVDKILPGANPALDASTIDSITGMDGFVVLYDPRESSTSQYAASIISQIPPDWPTIVLANFLDQRGMSDVMPATLLPMSQRFIHVQTSMLNNKGLHIIARWLDAVLLFRRRQMFVTLLRITDEELERREEELRLSIKAVDGDIEDE